MKHLFTFSFLVFFLSHNSFAQSIVPIPNDSAYVTGNVADEFDLVESHIHIINHYGSATTFTWGMVNYTDPSPVWELKLCDNNNCYDLLLGSPYHESNSVNNNDTMDMKFQFSPHCINGTANVNVVVYATNDSATTAIILNYKADLTTSCPTGILTIENKSLKIFPNPVQKTFTVSDFENASNLSFEVYDLKGAAMRSEIKSATNSQIEISVENLAKGEYVLKAFDANGKTIGTSHLTKVD